jgi:hypothetical protein
MKRCAGPSHPEPVALLPLHEFGRDRTRRDGLKVWCRRCVNFWQAAAVRRQGEELAAAPDGRRCATCGQVKNEEEFARLRTGPGGRRRKCRACSKPTGWLARPPDQRTAAGYGRVRVRRVSDADYSRGTEG